MRALRGLVGITAATASALALAAAPAAARSGSDFRFAEHDVVVHEADGRAVVPVQRDATAALEESRAWFTTVERSAVDGDFGEASGWIRMAVGQTSTSIVVNIHDDLDDELGDESFVLRLTQSPHGAAVLDEVVITIRDDDQAYEEVAVLPSVDGATAANRPVAAAAGAPAAVPAPARSVVRTKPQAARPPARREAAPRVTPFELRSPSDANADTSLPVPEHASPLLAASIIAALALARVSAEVWYRWRTAPS